MVVKNSLARRIIATVACVFAGSIARGEYKAFVPGHYVYGAGSSFSSGRIANYLNASDSNGGVVFRGVQQVYYWKDLEPTKDHYDFSQIDEDIETINALGRGQKLVIQFSYKSFSSGGYQFPNYVHDNPDGIYGNPASGGTGNGYYVTDTGSHYPYTWNPTVLARFRAMFQALGEHLDDNETLQAVNLCETAYGNASVDLNIYGDAIRTMFLDLRRALPRTRAIQYANGPKPQLTKWADACIASGVGWGGPDVVPTDVINQPSLENYLVGGNGSPGTYAFYYNHWSFNSVIGHVIGDKCVKGSAVQSPDYDFAAGFAQNYANATEALHLNYLFWCRNTWHETDIIDFVKDKVNAHGIAGGLNTTLPDTMPWFPGQAGIKAAERVPGNSLQLRVRWNPAIDDNTPSAQLVFEVYASTSSNASSVFSGTPIATFTGGVEEGLIDGLTIGTRYYLGVRVRDLTGNREMNTTVVAGPVMTGVAEGDWEAYR